MQLLFLGSPMLYWANYRNRIIQVKSFFGKKQNSEKKTSAECSVKNSIVCWSTSEDGSDVFNNKPFLHFLSCCFLDSTRYSRFYRLPLGGICQNKNFVIWTSYLSLGNLDIFSAHIPLSGLCAESLVTLHRRFPDFLRSFRRKLRKFITDFVRDPVQENMTLNRCLDFSLSDSPYQEFFLNVQNINLEISLRLKNAIMILMYRPYTLSISWRHVF